MTIIKIIMRLIKWMMTTTLDSNSFGKPRAENKKLVKNPPKN